MDFLPMVDWGILAVILVSTLISLIRGFIKEALSLAALIAAVIVARLFGAQVATLLVDYISVPSMRMMTAYGILFVATWSVGSMVNHLIAHVVEMTGLTGMDRLLGMLFGLLRGCLIIVIVVAVLQQFPVTEDNWWHGSRLIPIFADAADLIVGWVSANAGEVIEKGREI